MGATERQLRDWWTEGLLPRPTPRGRGRAKGKKFGWHDLTIIDRASTVLHLKKRRARFKDAHQLELFSLGYAVESQKLRQGLLSLLDYAKRCVLHAQSKPDGIDHALSKLSTRVSRKQSSQTGLSYEEIEALLKEVLLSVFSPFFQLDSDVSELAATADRLMRLRAAPHLNLPDITPAMLEDFLNWCKPNLSMKALSKVVSTTGEAQFQRAREVWSCLREFLGHLAKTAKDHPYDAAELQMIGAQFSRMFGGVALLALIWLLGHGYEPDVAHFVNLANEHLRREKNFS